MRWRMKLRSFRAPLLDLASASVLITGGTGSFGTALVRHFLAGGVPKRLIVFSRDEQKHDACAHLMRAEFPSKFDHLRFFLGDVRDKDRLELAMRGVDVVIHAAALKII